jgi:hypothetical protein
MKIRFPSPAMIVAIVALVCATTGSAVAGALITGAQIKNGTITGLDVRKETLTSAHVKNGSLRPVDFKGGKLPAGPQGPMGAQGAKGDQGPQGAQGVPGLAALQIVGVESPSSSSSSRNVTVTCPAGKQLVGGGAEVIGASGDVALDESYPNTQTTWIARAYEVNATADNWSLAAYAICAQVAS